MLRHWRWLRYTFGGILMIMLVSQIITGIVLVMHYTPHADMAFSAVEHIMRDVNYGWLLALHACGWRVDVLRGGLPAHLPRPVLRLLQGAARGSPGSLALSSIC
jgi:hypothetical protein